LSGWKEPSFRLSAAFRTYLPSGIRDAIPKATLNSSCNLNSCRLKDINSSQCYAETLSITHFDNCHVSVYRLSS
jgi:hypothetical protein